MEQVKLSIEQQDLLSAVICSTIAKLIGITDARHTMFQLSFYFGFYFSYSSPSAVEKR